MKLQHVPLELIQQVWPVIEGFVASENEAHGGGDYTTEQIRLLLSNGQWLLLVANDDAAVIHGAVMVVFNNMPNDRIAFVTFLSGRDMLSTDMFAQMVAICKAHGATKIQGAVRKAVARLLTKNGFYSRHTVVETRI